MKTTPFRLVALFVVTALIGAMDYVTGDELDLFILYFAPIAWAAWNVSRRAAIALSVFSGALWFSANVYLGHAYSQPLLGAWGEMVMLVTFLGAALATSGIRRLLDHERVLNRQLAEALAKVKKLTGRLPICMSCKNVQDDAGHWQAIEEYFTHQSEDDFVFAQRICPDCRDRGSHREGLAKSAPVEPELSSR
jgi:hypothetical protein